MWQRRSLTIISLTLRRHCKSCRASRQLLDLFVHHFIGMNAGGTFQTVHIPFGNIKLTVVERDEERRNDKLLEQSREALVLFFQSVDLIANGIFDGLSLAILFGKLFAPTLVD